MDLLCLHVKLSPHHSPFVASPNLATSRPGHAVVHGAEGPRGWNHVKMIGLGAGIVPWKFQAILSTFSLSKSQVSVLFGMAPPPGGLSSTKLGSLDIEPLYSTLCPSITPTRSTSNFYLNTLWYRVSGLIMLGQSASIIRLLLAQTGNFVLLHFAHYLRSGAMLLNALPGKISGSTTWYFDRSRWFLPAIRNDQFTVSLFLAWDVDMSSRKNRKEIQPLGYFQTFQISIA